jgi:hypothetical protein
MSARAPSSGNSAHAERPDAWWVQPLVTALVLTGFIVYATYRTFENDFFLTESSLKGAWQRGEVGHLLSPFYSPLILVDWKILGYHVSPALLILPFPLSFRLTCYYYRKAYYRSFFWQPPACAVEGTTKPGRYSGERAFPYVLQNLHRFAFYAAFIFIFILAYDVFLSMKYADGWGISVGTIVLGLNVTFLACYTFGCHSFRHLIGGNVNCYSCSLANRTKHGLWKKVTFLNDRHALFAWVSLFGVALADLYVRLVCSGALSDYVFARF